MATEFYLRKKRFYIIGCFILISFVLTTSVYAFVLQQSDSVWVGKTFYFLLSKNVHVEAGAYEAQQNGGAGYLFSENGKEYVALSVYLDGEIGASVAKELQDVVLVEKSVGQFHFTTKREKKNHLQYVSAFDCLYAYVSILEREIFRMDKGGTQESSKRVLNLLKRQFSFQRKKYQALFPDYAKLCDAATERLSKITDGVVLLKDLRYLLCYLADGYVQLSSRFVL